jgi:hypothetical protein
MPSVRRPRLPVRESKREWLPSNVHSSVTKRRPRRSKWVSFCVGSIRSVFGKEGLKYRPVAFTGLSCISAWKQRYHDLRIEFFVLHFGIAFMCFVTWAVPTLLMASKLLPKVCPDRVSRMKQGPTWRQYHGMPCTQMGKNVRRSRSRSNAEED